MSDNPRAKRVIEGLQRSLLQVDIAEIIIHEGDDPNVVAHLFDADTLAGEDGAEIDFLPVEADAPACGHGGGPVVERVIELRQASVGTR